MADISIQMDEICAEQREFVRYGELYGVALGIPRPEDRPGSVCRCIGNGFSGTYPPDMIVVHQAQYNPPGILADAVHSA